MIMVPYRFFWLFDFIILGVSFFFSKFLFTWIYEILIRLPAPWLSRLTKIFNPPPSWDGYLPPLESHIWIFLTMSIIVIVALGIMGNHRPLFEQSRARIMFGSFIAPLIGLSMISLILFAFKQQEWSRLFIFTYTFCCIVGLWGYRMVLRYYYLARREAGFYARNVLLIGLPRSIEWMAKHYRDHIISKDYYLFGYLQVPTHGAAYDEIKVENSFPLPNCLGNVEDLGKLLIHQPVHEVIVLLPTNGGDWLKQVIQDCDYFRIALHIVPELMLKEHWHDLQIFFRLEPLGLPSISLMPLYWNSEALFFKRLMDIVISGVMLVSLAPLFALVALAIRITTPRLPIFYSWNVVGYKGKKFTGYKFTTMIEDADEKKKQLMPFNEMTGPVFKIKNDPRVTPLGRFLRKYSINELPQLWSVLKGDMSLVGPRPAGPHELENYDFWHKRRLSVRPGITCLWQVRGRNAINNFDDWVKMDLEYIDKWSLWLDIKILIRTVWVVIKGTGS